MGSTPENRAKYKLRREQERIEEAKRAEKRRVVSIQQLELVNMHMMAACEGENIPKPVAARLVVKMAKSLARGAYFIARELPEGEDDDEEQEMYVGRQAKARAESAKRGVAMISDLPA